jgi:methylase of polypeptide subunit release factors
MNANERTFQGELFRIINSILEKNNDIGFDKITQEENVGVKRAPRFADGKLYSNKDNRKIVSFELKNSSWDATDEDLVIDAAKKALTNGFEYFVTGTPRQLALYRTFEAGKALPDRKIKIYTISNIKNDNDIMMSNRGYEKIIKEPVVKFLKELSKLVHNEIEIHWDSIDVVYINRLSAYILEASAEMLAPMTKKLDEDKEFRKQLKQYLRNQEIFNVTLDFNQDDVYKICQLANYILFIKIIFYSYLQRDVKELKLKSIEIPNDMKLLNVTLRTRFNDVLEHDYEMVFSENVFDQFEYSQQYIPVLKQNIEEIKKLEFKDLNVDVMGAIYNTLIDNQEQHDRGQHFTNTNEVDIICAFCLKKDTKTVLDSGCGAGTFLVRAYNFLKYYHPMLKHEELMEMLWGIDISPFPVFLSTINLCLLNIKVKDNYPIIINSDFLKVRKGFSYEIMFLNASKLHKLKKSYTKKTEVFFPDFDSCIGNPPYIRQELIEHKDKWIELVQVEHGLKKVNKQSDLYFYYLLHTASFLKNGCRLGYVISSSWLDVSFGGGLQKFLLDNFKIIAIIDHQTKRSFSTALINTVILIIEKCDDASSRDNNTVRFVKVYKDYSVLVGSFDDENRINKTIEFADKIEMISHEYSDDCFEVKPINQNELKEQSTLNGKYENGYWGAIHLRAPKIYFEITNHSQNLFVPVSQLCKVRYSIKSGKNSFFYMRDDTVLLATMNDEEYYSYFGNSDRNHVNWSIFGWFYSHMFNQHFIIEREFTRPIFKTQSEAKCLDVDIVNIYNYVLYCSMSKDELKKKKCYVYKYISKAEEKGYEVHKTPSIISRLNNLTTEWYDITKIAFVGDFIFPAKLGEKYRLIDNRIAQVPCDKVSYAVQVRKEYRDYADEIFLLLNSIYFRYIIDLFSRQMVVKVSDVDLNLVLRSRILDPKVFRNNISNLDHVYKMLKSREQESIFTEITKEDKKAIDLAILRSIGLGENELNELYKQAALYVQQRKEKSESLQKQKTKKVMDYDTSLRYIEDRFPDLSRYTNLITSIDCEKFTIPSGNPVFQKESSYQPDLFNEYLISFRNGKKTSNVAFRNQAQVELYRFLASIGYDKKTLLLPQNPDTCKTILDTLKHEYSNSIQLIKSLLKSNRSKANPQSIFRDIVIKD